MRMSGILHISYLSTYVATCLIPASHDLFTPFLMQFDSRAYCGVSNALFTQPRISQDTLSPNRYYDLFQMSYLHCPRHI